MNPVRKRDPWQDDSQFPRKYWQYEVANNDTSLGYLEWVDHKYEVAHEERESRKRRARRRGGR